MILPLLRRLEVLLDRSWEKESITWTGLTWWDPLPCGQDFVVQVQLSLGYTSFAFYSSILDLLSILPHLQVTRYLQPPLPSPALSLLCNPPTPRQPSSYLAHFPSRLQARSLSTSYSMNEACGTLANLSPESYQSVFSTSPDYAFPPTPSSSPPLLSRPCALPVGFPSPPDSVPRKVQDRQTRNPTTRRIFDFPSTTSSERVLPPPQYQPFTVPPPPPFHLPPPSSSTSSYLPVMVDRPPPSY